jgi:adenine-specific DNA-methyltransferase
VPGHVSGVECPSSVRRAVRQLSDVSTGDHSETKQSDGDTILVIKISHRVISGNPIVQQSGQRVVRTVAPRSVNLQPMSILAPSLPDRVQAVLDSIDLARLRLSQDLDGQRRVDLGQFLTPTPVARQLADMFSPATGDVRIADPGAGIGSLGATVVSHFLMQDPRPDTITLTAWEIDSAMSTGLKQTMDALGELCNDVGVGFSAEICQSDFLADGVDQLGAGMFAEREGFDAIVLNPPYRKIHTSSVERNLCRTIGLETTNLYTAFLAVAADLLVTGGELVAIVPRSFANGTYFTPFRQRFTTTMAFHRIHVYESRSRAFADDAVLQENVIFRAVRSTQRPDTVAITSSAGPEDHDPTHRDVRYDELIRPSDEARVIHIVPDATNQRIAKRISSLPCTLAELGVKVSTGRVVDFRAAEFLQADADGSTVPLIYPGHLRSGRIVWPMSSGKKPNALLNTLETADLMVPEGFYILTKRFSAKEERRRIVAALYDPSDVAPGPVSFENHLNYYHIDGNGLDRAFALGLRAYLNSTLVDLYFRQFSGHTQVNAGDLRSLRYPSKEQLRQLGEKIGDQKVGQLELDRLIDQELFMTDGDSDPVQIPHRVDESISVLRQLGFPRAQLNERSGLTLLALLGLSPTMLWPEASNPLIGITPMMEFFREHYGKTYAPNTRETVRRQSVHQFVDAGLIIANPDDPSRPTNSPKAVYQIEPSALGLLRTFGTDEWQKNLESYLASRETLREKYAAERVMARIPVTLPDGGNFTLSGGGQNVLVKHIVEEFCERWMPGARLIYIGDTDDKFAYYNREGLADLGVVIEEHGKMPDVVVYDVNRGWLVLIEAVTSHGPVDGKRRGELATLFADSSAPLVYVTAFLDRQAMMRYLTEIAWETEVWCASDPTHLIHFNGERYLGPYHT